MVVHCQVILLTLHYICIPVTTLHVKLNGVSNHCAHSKTKQLALWQGDNNVSSSKKICSLTNGNIIIEVNYSLENPVIVRFPWD